MERQTKLQDTPARINHRQATSARSSAARPLLELQRSIGNQAVQRLIRSPYIQTKLQVSTPGDPFEQEADRVADTVMRMSEPDENASRIQAKPLATQITRLVQREAEQPLEEEKEEAGASKPVQRVPLAVRDDDEEEKVARKVDVGHSPKEDEDKKTVQAKLATDTPLHQVSQPSERSQGPSCSGDCSIQRLCTKCEEEKQPVEEQPGEMVHRQAMSEQRADEDDVYEQRAQTKGAQTTTPKVTTSVAANVHALRGGGSPLPPATRAFFEPRFGADFSQVRVHTDSRAAKTANSISAGAFTVGQNIAFGAGRYSPHSNEGRHLLAHELTHVVQQSAANAASAGQSDGKHLPSDSLGPKAGPESSQITRGVQTLNRKPTSVTVSLVGPPPPVHAGERATPENRHLAGLIDEFDKLSNAELVKRRDEAAVAAADPVGNDQKEWQQKLEAIEFLAKRRGLAPLKLGRNWDKTPNRRVNLRVQIEEEIRKTGSFKKALSAHPNLLESDVDFFQAEADSFAARFRGQAWLTTERMLEGSLVAIGDVLHSYGLSDNSARLAAERLIRGSDVETEAENVVKLSAKGNDVDTEAKVTHRLRLAQWVERLKQQQQRVKALQDKIGRALTKVPYGGEGPAWEPVKKMNAEVVAARNALRVLWIQAERLHPIIAAYRRGGEIEKVDLGTLDTDPVEEQMKAILLQLLPKIVDIAKAKSRLKNKKNFGLTLPSVVALTRENMFIPPGSIRAGVVNDLVAEVKDDEDSVLMKVAAFALAIVTLIPSGGASLAIPAGMAAAGLAVYSAAKEWEKYDTQKMLVNTDIDLARSLSSEEPSLTGFAMSLVDLGLEALPLISAFKEARNIKKLVNAGEETTAAVERLNAFGRQNGVREKLGDRALAEAEKAEKRGATHVAEDVTAKAAEKRAAAHAAEDLTAKAARAKAIKSEVADLIGAPIRTTGGEIKLSKAGHLFKCTNPCTGFRDKYSTLLGKHGDLEKDLATLEKRSLDAAAEAKIGGPKAAEMAEAVKKDAAAFERRIELGLDPIKGYVPHEGEVGSLIESRFGGFIRSPHEGAEWISTSGKFKGKTFDLDGIPPGKTSFHSDKLENFLPSVESHFLKSVDFVVLDTRNMTPGQKLTLLNYLNTRWASELKRLILL